MQKKKTEELMDMLPGPRGNETTTSLAKANEVIYQYGQAIGHVLRRDDSHALKGLAPQN